MTGIRDYEIPNYASRLAQFLGTAHVARLVNGIKKAETSGPLEREFYLQKRHPWAKGFHDLRKLAKKRHYTLSDITDDIRRVGTDAAMYLPLLEAPDMPQRLRNGFKSRLADTNRGRDAIFELTTAHRFKSIGGVSWVDDNSTPGAEFSVSVGNRPLYIECKALEEDSGKNYKRKDFYRLADFISAPVLRRKLHGQIHIELAQKLITTHQAFTHATKAIENAIKSNNLNESLNLGWCTIQLGLRIVSGVNLGAGAIFPYIKSSIPEGATAATYFRTPDGADPLIISIVSKQQNQIIRTILDKISSTKRQIGTEGFGAAYIYLSEYTAGELTELNQFHPFGQIIEKYFTERAAPNLAAIVFISGPFYTPTFFGSRMGHEGLCYRNPKLVDDPIYNFPFIERASS